MTLLLTIFAAKWVRTLSCSESLKSAGKSSFWSFQSKIQACFRSSKTQSVISTNCIAKGSKISVINWASSLYKISSVFFPKVSRSKILKQWPWIYATICTICTNTPYTTIQCLFWIIFLGCTVEHWFYRILHIQKCCYNQLHYYGIFIITTKRFQDSMAIVDFRSIYVPISRWKRHVKVHFLPNNFSTYCRFNRWKRE